MVAWADRSIMAGAALFRHSSFVIRHFTFQIGFLVVAALQLSSVASADDQVRPDQLLELLKTRCGDCHGEKKPKGGLSLVDFEGIAKGNKRGAVVSPGAPGESLLWEVVADDRMPPDDPLSEDERGLLKRWIQQGATGFKANPNAHWAFRPVVRPEVPRPANDRIRNDVDRFLAEKFVPERLMFRQEASRETLIRRVAFDLTGLPPAPEEITEYLQDKASDAYERMVDRYLDSPRYGERWGKYWLDVAGYADSNGYFNADSHRPLAYRYRDYVIAAFNSDKPYDRFLLEQIAGDELCGYVPGGDVTREMVEPLTATHFLRNAPDGTGESDGNPDEVAIDKFSVIEGNLQITLNGLMGLTIQCAKCHSHKFEPISHEEYYRLEAVLFAAYQPANWRKPNERVATIGTVAEREKHQHETGRLDRQISAYKSSVERITNVLREQLIEERLSELPPAERAAVLEALRLPGDKRNDAQKKLLKQQVEPLKITDEEVAKRFPELATQREPLERAIAEREKARPAPLDTIAVLHDIEAVPPVHHIHLRGQHKTPGPEVQPGALSAVSTPGNPFRWEPPAEGKATSGRRLAFARWLTSPENPLVARVFVNRVWQFHFGTGLVPTPDNFGQAGAKPSHPELLDYLAAEFVEHGWRLKPLHRLIMRSAAYRQGHETDAAGLEADPQNRLLWHFPVRRLDAEAVRDAMLAVSGELNLQMGGPCVSTQHAADGSVIVDAKNEGSLRRSVYIQQRRTQVLTFLELFDAPQIVTNCSFRNTSTVPLQSLALLNSEFVRDRSTAFAARVRSMTGRDRGEFIASAFRLSCGRDPTVRERELSAEFVTRQQNLHGDAADSQSLAEVDLCQMLLASNAFLYVE